MGAESVTEESDRSCCLSGVSSSSSTEEFPKRKFREQFHLELWKNKTIHWKIPSPTKNILSKKLL